ncbi:hypothetical protein FRB96_005534 [Tulasnella sp. 330]|nr:hypothetical protein FRB96_005534 [Tulasnella sp. 330]
MVKARIILLRTSLIHEIVKTNTVQLLSPVRSYIARTQQVTPELWRGLYSFSSNYVGQHISTAEAKTSVEGFAARSTEDLNLETILLHRLRGHSSEAIITASLDFSYYHYWTRPRSEIMSAGINASEKLGDICIITRCLERLGDLETAGYEWAGALLAYTKARTRDPEADGVHAIPMEENDALD